MSVVAGAEVIVNERLLKVPDTCSLLDLLSYLLKNCLWILAIRAWLPVLKATPTAGCGSQKFSPTDRPVNENSSRVSGNQVSTLDGLTHSR